MLRRLLVLFAILFGISGLVSCAGIPMSGPVNKGGSVAQADSGYVQFLPDGPADGASKEEILRGFIEASSSSNDDYAIARLFLAPTQKEEWDPNAGVVVDDARRLITVDGDTAELVTGEIASLTAQGEYSTFDTAQDVSLSYSFVQVDGQWRISAAPAGIVIDNTTFEQVYETHALYFFDPSYTYLVPDVRWFARGNTTSTRIVKTLMAGPASWLREPDAVRTAFNAQVVLATDSVPVVDGVAAVNLSDAILSESAVQKQRIRQQLGASLSTVNGVQSVAMLVDGALQTNLITSPLESMLPEPVDSQPLVATAESFGFVNGNSVTPLEKLSAQVVALKPNALAFESALNLVALRNAEGLYLLNSPLESKLVDVRPGLIAPTVDWTGYAWIAPADNPSGLEALNKEGVHLPLSTPWADATSITAMEVSRDGTRLVALVSYGTETRLEVAGITRNTRKQPVAIGTPKILETFNTPMTDVTWVNGQSVAVAGPTVDATTSVTVYTVGGSFTTRPAIKSNTIVSISGANLISQLKAVDSAGNLYLLQDASLWQVSRNDVVALATVQ